MFTPPLRELTPETSLGFHVIAFAETVLLIDLHPWQKWLLIHMLELRTDNTLRFRTVLVLVARQNGKSLISQIVALWMMYVYGVNLVLGTAQDLDTAEEVWQGAVDLVTELDDETDEPIRPDLFELLDKVVQVNGKKALVLTSRRRYKVKAANRRAGRGLSGDVILLDELREHQSWDAWGSITKTTMARAMALILCLSNAGDATSIVLRYLRLMGHAAAGDPDGLNAQRAAAEDSPTNADLEDFTPEAEELVDDEETLGIFEWSAPPGCAVMDRDGWAAANPSMNHANGIAERTIAAAAKTDPEFVFRPEVLCQFLDGTADGFYPADSWQRSEDPESMRGPDEPVALCIDTAWDRATTHIGLASRRTDGEIHVEVIASRPGQDWVAGWLRPENPEDRSEAVRAAPVAVQAKGAPASPLIEELRAVGTAPDDDREPITVVEWDAPSMATGCGNFYDRIRATLPVDDVDDDETASDQQQGEPLAQIRHRGQQLLNMAAANAASKPFGDAWILDRRKSPLDIAPLVAVNGAVWLLTLGMPDPPARSAYESRGVMTI